MNAALAPTCVKLGLSRGAFERASQLLARLAARGDWPNTWRGTPLAGALAYCASRDLGEAITQDAAAAAAATSPGTIRR